MGVVHTPRQHSGPLHDTPSLLHMIYAMVPHMAHHTSQHQMKSDAFDSVTQCSCTSCTLLAPCGCLSCGTCDLVIILEQRQYSGTHTHAFFM